MVLDNLVEFGIILCWPNGQKCCQGTIYCAALRPQRLLLGFLFKAMIIFFNSFCNGKPRRKNSVELITITWKMQDSKVQARAQLITVFRHLHFVQDSKDFSKQLATGSISSRSLFLWRYQLAASSLMEIEQR